MVERTEPPGWLEADGWVGGAVVGHAVLASTPSTLAYVLNFRSYPSGFTFGMGFLLSRPARADDETWFETEPEVRVAFSDGSWGSSDHFDDAESDEDGASLLVKCRGGPSTTMDMDGTGDARSAASVWVGALPTAGPVDVTVSWPEFDIHGAAQLDGGAVRDAATAAVRLRRPEV